MYRTGQSGRGSCPLRSIKTRSNSPDSTPVRRSPHPLRPIERMMQQKNEPCASIRSVIGYDANSCNTAGTPHLITTTNASEPPCSIGGTVIKTQCFQHTTDLRCVFLLKPSRSRDESGGCRQASAVRRGDHPDARAWTTTFREGCAVPLKWHLERNRFILCLGRTHRSPTDLLDRSVQLKDTSPSPTFLCLRHVPVSYLFVSSPGGSVPAPRPRPHPIFHRPPR